MPRTNGAENRTNSLVLAKSDCHTCAALKEHCDRRRPRCGTCMTNKRRCGGFAMDLVWKDPAVVNDETLSRGSRGSGCRSDKGSQHQAFKFTHGRPKRRRKSRDTSNVYQSVLDLGLDNTTCHRATRSPNTTSTNDLSSASTPGILNSGEVGASRGWDGQSCGFMTYQLQHATHLSPGWQQLSGVVDSVDAQLIHPSGPDAAEPVEFPNKLILDQTNNDLADGPFPVAGCESSSSNCFAERSPNHDGVEEDAQPIFSIKYRDLAHKYRTILAMCMWT